MMSLTLLLFVFVLSAHCFLLSSIQLPPSCTHSPLLGVFLLFVVSPRAHLHVVGLLSFMSLTYANQPPPPPFFKFCSLVYFCLYGPFYCISFHKFSRQLSAFSLCFSGLISAILVLSTIISLSIYASLPLL